MSSGTAIVKNALEKIGQHSQIRPANPASIEKGFKALNSLLQFWLLQNIDLGIVPTAVPGDDIYEPADTTLVIESVLAMELAPSYDNGNPNVSETLKNNARVGFATMRDRYRVITIPPKELSSTTPLGAGHNTRFHDRTFVGQNTFLEN